MKFIDSIANSVEGESYVKVKHHGKIYSGKARLHPEDEWSDFTGCRYAEERAEIKALKEEWKQKKTACEECRKFVVAVSQYAAFDKESASARAMFRQLNRRIKEVNKLAETISEKQFALNVAIRQQDGFNKRINQMKLNSIEEK